MYYLVPFLTYLAPSNGVTLKYGLQVTQGHWKWYHLKKLLYSFLFEFHSNYNDPILYHFRDRGVATEVQGVRAAQGGTCQGRQTAEKL